MNSADVAFIKSLKGVGIARAKELFEIAECFSGDFETSVPTRKSEKHFLRIADKALATIPSKKRGYTLNPNCNRQKVFTAVKEFLLQHKSASRLEVVDYAIKKTGLKPSIVKCNVDQTPDIVKVSHGIWALKAA